MKIIGIHNPLIGVLFLTVFVGVAAGLYFDQACRFQRVSKNETAGQQYTCPMHSDVVKAKLATCHKCGMALVSANEPTTVHAGCCADNGTIESATELRLPPGHPPVPGWTTEPTSKGEPASSNTTTHFSH